MECYTRDHRHSESKLRILLYSSCVAEQLRQYFLRDPWVSSNFSVDCLLIHILEWDNVKDLAESNYRKYVEEADMILTNCFSPRWENLGLDRVKSLAKSSCQIFTWVPPNCGALWPAHELQGGDVAVLHLLRQGLSAKDIIRMFELHTFDPLFKTRWNHQISRLKLLENDWNVGIADFCQRNHRKVKLWFTENHPTYNTVAWIGSQLVTKFGGEPDNEQTCLAYSHDLTGIWTVWPETTYEFEHFEFDYPMRYQTTPNWGGKEWYHSQIIKIADRFRNGGTCVP